MNGTGNAATFYEQLGGVAGVFEQWGACERTVVAVALARRVPWPGLRLLQRAVDAALMLHVEDERLERDANDEAVLAGLLAPRPNADDDDSERLTQLLTLLPLLRTDNLRAAQAYVAAAPALVQRCVDGRRRDKATELCRQLLSYLLVHPALTVHDQSTLTQWLRYLENHISGNRTESVWQQRIDPALLPENIWSTSSSTFRRTIGKNVEFRGIADIDASFSTELQESFSKNGRDVEISLEGEKLNFDLAVAQPKSQRSNSLTPPSTTLLQASSAESLHDEPFVQKPRSFSLSSEHSLSQMRPLMLHGGAGSETRLDELRGNSFGTSAHAGMAAVGQWLKGLRLHKYVWLFTNISYDQMCAIDEEYLEKLGVTKGARHKILVSIKKLNEREAVVAAVRNELAAAVPTASTANILPTAGNVLPSPGNVLPTAGNVLPSPGNVMSTAGNVMSTPSNVSTGVPSCVLRCLERLRVVLLSPMPPDSTLPAAIVQALDLASKCIMSSGPAPTSQSLAPPVAPPAPPVPHAPSDDADSAPPVDPLSLHCWLVERALHHEAFSRPELQAALRRLRHRLPPKQFFHHVCDMPLARKGLKPKWRAGPPGTYPRRWQAPPPPPSRNKSHSYPPFPAGARLPRPAPPAPALPDDYSGLDALCLQMTEQAIN